MAVSVFAQDLALQGGLGCSRPPGSCSAEGWAACGCEEPSDVLNPPRSKPGCWEAAAARHAAKRPPEVPVKERRSGERREAPGSAPPRGPALPYLEAAALLCRDVQQVEVDALQLLVAAQALENNRGGFA